MSQVPTNLEHRRLEALRSLHEKAAKSMAHQKLQHNATTNFNRQNSHHHQYNPSGDTINYTHRGNQRSVSNNNHYNVNNIQHSHRPTFSNAKKPIASQGIRHGGQLHNKTRHVPSSLPAHPGFQPKASMPLRPISSNNMSDDSVEIVGVAPSTEKKSTNKSTSQLRTGLTLKGMFLSLHFFIHVLT